MLSFAILIVGLWGLGGFGLLLHRISLRFGLAPLFGYVAAVIVLSSVADWLALPVELTPGVIFRISGQVFVPLLLVIFLIVYIAAGTRLAQAMFLELAGVSAVIAFFLILLLLQQRAGSTIVMPDLTMNIGPAGTEWLRETAARLVTLAADMVLIAILYQAMRNVLTRFPPWLVAGLSLLLSLWVDFTVFDLLTASGTSGLSLLPGRVVATTLIALAIWPLLAWYLARVASRLSGYAGANERPAFDITSGMFGVASEAVKQPLAEGQAGNTPADGAPAIGPDRTQNQILREFMRESAHDLRNPLASIKLKIELLRRITDSEAQKAHLDDLEKRVDHMANLIDDLSVFTYLTGVDSLVLRPVNMNHLAHNVYQVMLPLAERKGLSLNANFEAGDAPLMVQGDHDELLRALANLLVNAIHYTDTGRIALSVDRSDEHVCVVKVSDTGRGIEAQDLPKIFERGFRASEVVKAGIEGTGLGLAIVRRVVDLHGGTIDARSEPGQGTTLTLTLPLADTVPEVD